MNCFEGINSQDKLAQDFGLPPEVNEQLQQRLAGWDSSDGDSRDGTDGHISLFRKSSVSSSIPASSSESLTFLPFTRVDSFRRDQPNSVLSPSPCGSSSAPSHVTSALTTPSLCSTSPNSSAGSSSLPLSLPPSKRIFDAAMLHKATPHGTSFNEYLRKIYTGQEVTSDSSLAPRKSSLDYHQLHPNMFVEPVQRSTSLRQPLVERCDDGKAWKLLGARPKISAGLSVARSNSDKSQKSSLFSLYSDAQRTVAQSESNKSHKSSMYSLPSEAMQSDSSTSQKPSTTAVRRSDSDKNQRSSVSRSDSNKSQTSSSQFSFSSEVLTRGNAVAQSGGCVNPNSPTSYVRRSDSDKNQRASAVTCADSKQIQKSSALPLHYNALSEANVTFSENSNSQMSASMLPLLMDVSVARTEQPTPAWHSDVLLCYASATRTNNNKSPISSSLIQPTVIRSNVASQIYSASAVHQDTCSLSKGREDAHQVSSLPYTIMPVEAQIQKLRFVPTMTAVSTPVRPTPEKPIGNLPTYHQHHHPAYIPEYLSASVTRPLLQQAGILCKPYQELVVNAIPSDAGNQDNADILLAGAAPQQSSAAFIPTQSLVFVPSEDELLENNCCERGSPPPYGAFHSTIITRPSNAISPMVMHANANTGNERNPNSWLPLNNPTGFVLQQPQTVSSLQTADMKNSSKNMLYWDETARSMDTARTPGFAAAVFDQVSLIYMFRLSQTTDTYALHQ